MLEIKVYPDAPAFLAETGPVLEAAELDNNFILGLAGGVEPTPSDWTLLSAVERGTVGAAALKAGAMFFLSPTENAGALHGFARHLLDHRLHPQTVIAPAATAETFAAHYGAGQEGGRARLIVHGLHAVAPVTMPPGNFETPRPQHFDLLARWVHAFHVDAGLPPQSDETVRAQLARRIAAGKFFIWTRDGEPVSMTAVMRNTRRIAIVGLVYTPPEHRGHGYATGLVAQQSTLLLAHGFEQCGLFTDADNPTSNHIYYKIGYRPGREFTEIKFAER